MVKVHMLFFIILQKWKVGSYSSLLLTKTLTFYNVIILVKSVFNKDKFFNNDKTY